MIASKTSFFSLLLLPLLLFAQAVTPNLIPPAASPTASPSKISVFFTPTAPNSPNSPYSHLHKLIQNAKESIFIAAYKFSLLNIIDLLGKKSRQGVSVELFLEKDWAYSPENHYFVNRIKKNNIKLFLDRKNSGLMHNKFLIVDRKNVFSGSANFSLNGYFFNYNDLISFQSKPIADVLLKNFFHLSRKLHFKSRAFSINRTFNSLPARPVQLSPYESIEVVIPRSTIDWKRKLFLFTKNSTKQIDFVTFVFSLLPLSIEMEKLLQKGLKIRGILENLYESENVIRSWKTIPFARLARKGANVKYDAPQTLIHHKLLISDTQKILTGSLNFSKNALFRNDEAFFLIHSAPAAKIYSAYFNTLWKSISHKTTFEKYIVAKRNKKIQGSYSHYLQIYQSNQFYQKNLELLNNAFYGTAVKILSGDTLLIKLAASKILIPFKLIALDAPKEGIHSFNQNPHFFIAKEILTLLIANQKVKGIILKKQQDGKKYYSGTLFQINNNFPLRKSINEKILQLGAAFLNYSTLSNQLPPPLIQNFLIAATLGKKLQPKLFHNIPLLHHPSAFQQKLNQFLLDLTYQEAKYSIAYQYGAFIGNRKTKKVYPPNHPTYLNYLKSLDDQKLIFFSNISTSKKAGYFFASPYSLH